MPQKRSSKIRIVILLAVLLLVALVSGLILLENHTGTKPSLPLSAPRAPLAVSPGPLPVLEMDEHQQMLQEARKREELSRTKYNTKDTSTWIPYLAEVLKLEEKEGRKNAMSCYTMAGLLMPRWEDRRSTLSNLVNNVLAKGWSEKAEALKPYLAEWQPAFADIRTGVSIGYAKGTGVEQGSASMVPDLRLVEPAVKALCAEGRLHEKEGRVDEAVKNYLAAFSLANDYASPGNCLRVLQAGVDAEPISLQQIARLVLTDTLSSGSLDLVQGSLSRTKDLIPILCEIASEESRAWQKVDLPLTIRSIEDASAQYSMVSDLGRATWEAMLFRDMSSLKMVTRRRKMHLRDKQLLRELTSKSDPIQPKIKVLDDLVRSYLDDEGWSNEKHLKLLSEINALPINKYVLASLSLNVLKPVDAKSSVVYAEGSRNVCKVALAIMLYRSRKGECPTNLTELKKDYFPQGIPTDPYTGKALSYGRQKTRDGEVIVFQGMRIGSKEVPVIVPIGIPPIQ